MSAGKRYSQDTTGTLGRGHSPASHYLMLSLGVSLYGGMFLVPEPLATHFMLFSRAFTDGTSQHVRDHNQRPQRPWGLLKGQPRWVCPAGSLVIQKRAASVVFNHNAERGQLDTIPGDSSGDHKPIPKFPDTSELGCPLGAQAIHPLLLVSRESAADANAIYVSMHTLTQVHVHTHMYKYGHAHVYMYTLTCVHMCTCLYVHAFYTCTAHTSISIDTGMCAHTY